MPNNIPCPSSPSRRALYRLQSPTTEPVISLELRAHRGTIFPARQASAARPALRPSTFPVLREPRPHPIRVHKKSRRIALTGGEFPRNSPPSYTLRTQIETIHRRTK